MRMAKWRYQQKYTRYF